jgi:hypothetical protein
MVLLRPNAVAETKRHLAMGMLLKNAGSLDRPLTAGGANIVVAPASSSDDAKMPPLWLMIQVMMSDVSDEEMARVLSANSRAIDRKLYGPRDY